MAGGDIVRRRRFTLMGWALLCASALLIAGDMGTEAAAQPKSSVAAATALRERRAMLGRARSWAYQLRIKDLAPLFASEADLLVVDHGYAALQQGKLLLDPSDVTKLKTKPDGSRRLVLAYMSIGEAEQYRFYWQPAWCRRATAPAWIGAVNPNWPGNYPARFWDAAWQKLILDPADGYLARIQAQGFDGIYLDRTDVYAEWLKERPSAEADMIAFLSRIATVARSGDPKFLVVLQNAEELLRYKSVRDLLDGVAKEDLLYGEAFSEAANAPNSIATSRNYLQRARADRMPVFAVEYLSDDISRAAAQARLIALGFIPTLAPRLLDRLIPQPGAPSAPVAAAPPVIVTQPGPMPAAGEGGPTCLLD